MKRIQYEALKTVVVDGKDTICVLPAKYGRSLSDWLPPYVCDECVCFLNNSGEEKINSFIVVVSLLNFFL